VRKHLQNIDHCVVLVEDFDRAFKAFTRLGFTVSPLGRHGAEMGTGNHQVMLADSYIELLGVLEPVAFNQQIRAALDARGEGIAAVALQTDDAAAATAEIRADGIAVGEPQAVARPVELPDGTAAEARFAIAYFPEHTTPYLQVFCSEIITPQHTWIPSLMSHANTAWGIDRLVVLTQTPDDLAMDMARLVSAAPQRDELGTVPVPVGRTPVVYATRDVLAAQYPGVDLAAVAEVGPAALTVKVHDIAAAEGVLRDSGVMFTVTDQGLLVAPQDACGVLLILRAEPRD
jgi:hypothetical protein